MKVQAFTNALIERVRRDSWFREMRVLYAYPDTVKPTRLSRVHIAMGIREMDLKPCFVDSTAQAGEVSVFADIYIPLKMDSALAEEVLRQLCRVLGGYNVAGISASKLTADKYTQANVLRTVFTFNDLIEWDGDTDA